MWGIFLSSKPIEDKEDVKSSDVIVTSRDSHATDSDLDLDSELDLDKDKDKDLDKTRQDECKNALIY